MASPTPRSVRVCLRLLFVLTAFLSGALLSQAQKVVVQDAGGGRKMELVYDASGKIVETRTIAPDGTVEVRNSLEYKPGFFAPQETNISYWPGSKQPEISTHVTYDENANFTGELVEMFDQGGKHTAGHKLIHVPQTGVYRCWDWDGAAQAYKSVKCPSGEESGERPEGFRTITRAQAVAFLAQARQKAAAERKSHSVALGRPTEAPGTPGNLNVGIVLPSRLVPGQHVSGSVVQDLQPYEGFSDVTLIPLTIPLDASEVATPLRGWEIVAAGTKPQPADSPFSFVVPRKAQLDLTLRHSTNPAQSFSRTTPIVKTSRAEAPLSNFEAPIVIVKDNICEVRGHFTGDASHAFASVSDQPAPIVAETPRVAFLKVPEESSEGQHHIIFSEGSTLVAIPVVVAELSFEPEPQSVKAGQPSLMISRLSGVDQLPEKAWRAGIFPPSSLHRARKLLPGFTPAEEGTRREVQAEEKEAKHKKEGSSEEAAEANSGTILLVLKNQTPEDASLRGSKDQTFSFTLKPDAFEQGDFVYKFVADPIRSGPLAVKSAVIPFLAPSTARPFSPR